MAFWRNGAVVAGGGTRNCFALGLHALVGVPVTGAFLACAPGGLAERNLIALSLQGSVAYVTVHHVARIILAVMIAKVGARWLV